MSALRRTAAVIAVFLLAAPLVSALAAQTTAQDTLDRLSATAPAPLAVTQASLPTTANLELQAPKARIIAAGVTQRVSGTSNVPTLFAARATQESRNPAMMVVGGAALIVGAVVGGRAGSVIMIGGGILGLVGLWNYMQ